MGRTSRKRGATDDQASGVAKKPRSGSKQAVGRTTRQSKEPLAENTGEPERLLRQRRREQQQQHAKESPKAPRHSRRSKEQQEKGKEAPAARREAARDAVAGMERRQRQSSGSGGAAGQPAQQQAQQGGGRTEGDEDDRSTLQGLLRRLGAGFEDIFPGGAMGGSSRVRAILAQLREEDEASQLVGLTELCEHLSISTEDSLAAFPTEQAVPLLVGFLSYEHNPDLMLLAARALTFLADVFPPAAASIIRHGAVPQLCARLLTIEYIDLAEQSLQALEKLSHEHPARLLEAGALGAVLAYIDFFQTGVQRVAVATAASMCRGLGTQHAEAAVGAAPILIGLLQYPDARLVDSACLALARVAAAFARSPPHLEQLCGLGLVASIVQMVGVSEAGSMSSQLQVSTFYGLLKILATMAAGSHVVAEALLQAGISDTLRNLLATSSLLSATAASPGNVLRSTEQLGDLVALAAALLPPIPDAAAAMLQDVPPSPSFGDGDEAATAAGQRGGGEACQRARFLRDNPALLQKLSADLLPLLIKVYYSSVTPQVKRHCLTTMARMLHFNSPDTLRVLLEDLPAASLVAALLGARDSTVVAYGMQMAEILMEKLPELYRQHFLKEGVAHAIQQLASAPPPEPPAAAVTTGAPAAASTRGRRSSGRPASRAADKDGGEAGKAAVEDARTPAGDTLRAAVGARARRFHARHFTDGEGVAVGCETEGVRLLRDICARLPHPSAVSALLEALSGSGASSVSTFELLSSGAVAALRAFLQGDDLADSPDRQQLLLERLGEFAAAALPPGSGGEPPLRMLVDKLLGTLAASEKFAVQLNPISPLPAAATLYGGAYYRAAGLARSSASGGGSSSLSAGLAALSNPLRIRLSRAGDEAGLRDYAHNTVLIEPLASMAQIEDFLWPRVNAPGPPAAGGAAGDDPRSRQAARSGAAARAAAEPSVGNPVGRGGSGSAEAACGPRQREQQAEAAAAAAAKGGGRSRSRGRQASKEQPIPQRRLTRAQARLAAEAEVAAQGSGSEEEREQAGVHAPAAGEAAEAATRAEAEEQMLVGDDGEGDDGEYSEDEEMEEAGYVEGEDEEYDEEEDEELDGMAAHVHDMHLGEADGAAAAEAGNGDGAAVSPGAAGGAEAGREAAGGTGRGAATGGPQSYAQAAGQRQAGASGAGGGAAQPQPHLAFYLGGRLLTPGTTVFQAVQQQLAAGGGGDAASSSASGGGADLGHLLWGEVHTISYRSWGAALQLQQNEAAASTATPRAGGAGRRGAAAALEAGDADSAAAGRDDASASPLAELLEGGHLPADLCAPRDALDALAVLRLAERLNRLAPHLAAWQAGRRGKLLPAGLPPPGHLPRDAFLSAKLSPKLSQQLKDVLSICGGALPGWCRQLVHGARFLFPFEARRRFFHCTSFGLARALHYLQQAHAAEHGPASAADREAAGNLRIGRVQRQKVRISRRRLLDSALKVFELYAGARAQLEVEFFGEVGTGLGPTLEFYTLLSHELQRKSLGIWRGGGGGGAPATVEQAKQAAAAAATRGAAGPGPLAGELEGTGGQPGEGVRAEDLVAAPQGLFPAPLPPGARGEDSKAASYFRLLGRAVAKALQDCRLLDLPLSPLLYRLALGRPVDLFDMRAVDAQLGASLERLHAALHAHAAAGGSGPLLVDGCPLEELCLTFELPGYPGHALHPDGAETPVTASNLGAYLDAVVGATLGAGVAAQVAAFRAGFEAIFPVSCLAAFYEDEIEVMLCGTGEAWSAAQLGEVIKFDHGYSPCSPPVLALLEVLAELDGVDQRRFLRFVTGTPRLPPGGLAALQPRLTVVRKSAAAAAGGEGGSAPQGSAPSLGAGTPGVGGRHPADGDLPSVMTCANYLKLPPYSSKEVLRERLLYAIREGQGSFDLS